MAPTDDYYTKSGKYLGTDGATTNDVRVLDEDAYNSILANHDYSAGSTAELQSNSKKLSIMSAADQATYMSKVYTTGNGAGSGTGAAFNVPIVLDADAGTLGFGTPQAPGTVDSAPLNYDYVNGSSYVSGTGPTGPNDPSSGQVIVGVAHR